MMPRRRAQSGFSLVEMLVAAFILAVGILGLTMLQLFAIRTNTSSGNLTKALAVANRTMETVAMEGRRSMLWKTEGRTPTLAEYTYLGTDPVTRYITTKGDIHSTVADAKASGELYFTVLVTPSETMIAQGTESVAGVPTLVTLGTTSLFTVEVSYVDEIVTSGGTTKVLTRNVRLARRVSHA